MADAPSPHAYPSTHPRWTIPALLLTLPLAPWIAVNRGVYNWSWAAAVPAHLIGLAALPLWYIGNIDFDFDQTRVIYLLVLFELIAIAFAGALQVFAFIDGKSLHTYLLATQRLYFASPFIAAVAWLLTFWGEFLYEISENASAGELRVISFIVLITIISSFAGIITALIATVRAGRPGWTCRWPPGCENCNYTLLGLPPNATCPECGRPSADSLARSLRAGVTHAAPSRWRRGWLVLLKPSRLGLFVTTRGPEPFPILGWFIAFASVWLACLYGMLVIQSSFSATSIDADTSPRALIHTLLLRDWSTGTQRNQMLIVMSAFAWFYAAALLLIINFSALVAERAGGNRGFAPVRQAIHCLPAHWALAIIVAVGLTLWHSLSLTFLWLNPIAITLTAIDNTEATIPESLLELAETIPLLTLVLWAIGVFAWFTYALSRVARATRYANW
ncbi:MAG: hypothetical protein RIG82_02125 [Phycisphaeraceae bacterium]